MNIPNYNINDNEKKLKVKSEAINKMSRLTSPYIIS